jgi:hypothetical protein
MNSRLTKLVALCVVGAVVALASGASADVLWDQSDYDVWGMGFFNSESGGPPFGMTWHGANDVTVDGGWNVESITSYYSAMDLAWGEAIAQGYLHVFPKTGPLPIEDPTLSVLVPMSGVLVGDHFAVTAPGLGLYLAPGDYWLGITPIAPSGPFGPEVQLSSMTFLGNETVSYDAFAFPGPPAWFVFNPGLDAAMLVEGTIAGTPVEETTWGNVKAMYR